MGADILNILDLKAEIAKLKASKEAQEQAIAEHFKSPAAIFHTVTSLFKGAASSPDGAKGGISSFLGHPDVISLLSRVVIPFVLNKTLFRGSNFIIKAAVGLLSQRVSGFINEKSVMSVWDKIKSFIPKKKAPKMRPSQYEEKLLKAGVY